MRPAAHPIRSVVILLASVVAVLLIATLIVVRPWHTGVAAAPSAEASGTLGVAGADGAPRVLVFGDSWTYGSAATRPELGYAYRLAEVAGWQTLVDGERGSGYLKEGLAGNTFGERIARLDPELDPEIVIVQGSINDRRQGAAGYREAVVAAWDSLAATYPEATIVILGPAPQILPVEPETARIDRDLSELAAARDWPYISPIAEDWITDANYLDVIDVSETGRDHPSDAGHQYLAERVAESVARFAPSEPVEALDEPGVDG